EDVDLEAELRAADGGAHPEIRDGVVPGAVAAEPGADGVDAGRRPQIAVEQEVGGRKADSPAALVAALDAAVDLPGTAEQRGGSPRIARLQQLADAGRGIELGAGAHGFDDGDVEAELLAHLRQQRGSAVPAAAEDEIVSDDGMAEGEPADENVADEIFSAALRHAA